VQVNNRLMEKANLGLMGLQQNCYAPPPQCAWLQQSDLLLGGPNACGTQAQYTPLLRCLAQS
jgi:hypothetical protein